MRQAAGLALLAASMPALPLLMAAGPGIFFYAALVPVAVWLVRADASFRRAAPAALIAWGAMFGAALAGMGMTVSDGSNPLVVVGGGDSALVGLSALLLVAPVVPPLVLFALGAQGRCRRLARAAGVMLIAGLLILPVQQGLGAGSPAALPFLAAYLLVLAAFGPLAWPRVRAAASHPAPDSRSTEA
jgi:hypothetical protein